MINGFIQRVLSDSANSPSSKRVMAFLAFINFLLLVNYEVFAAQPVNRELLIMLLTVVGAGIFGATFEIKNGKTPNT